MPSQYQDGLLLGMRVIDPWHSAFLITVVHWLFRSIDTAGKPSKQQIEPLEGSDGVSLYVEIKINGRELPISHFTTCGMNSLIEHETQVGHWKRLLIISGM
jgi:hypothetical protein